MLKKYLRSQEKADISVQPRTSFISSENELPGGIIIENLSVKKMKKQRSIELGCIADTKLPAEARSSFPEMPEELKVMRTHESEGKSRDNADLRRESYEHKPRPNQDVEQQARALSWGAGSKNYAPSNHQLTDRPHSAKGIHNRDSSVYRIARESSLQHIVLDLKKREYSTQMTLPSSSDEKSDHEDISTAGFRFAASGSGEEDQHSILLQNSIESPRSTTLADVDCLELMYFNMETNSEEVGEETSCSINETSVSKPNQNMISALCFKDPIMPGWRKSLKVAELQHVMRLQTVDSDAENENFTTPPLNKKLKEGHPSGERLKVAKTEILRLKKDKARYWKDRKRYRTERDLFKTAHIKIHNECSALKVKVRKLKSKLEIEKESRVQFALQLKQLLGLFDVEGQEREDSVFVGSVCALLQQELSNKIETLLAEFDKSKQSEKRMTKDYETLLSRFQESLGSLDKLHGSFNHQGVSNWSDSLLFNNGSDEGSWIDRGASGESRRSKEQVILSLADDGKGLGKVFNRNIAGDLIAQMEEYEKFRKLYEWRIRAFHGKVKDMETKLKQLKENWKELSRKHKNDLAELREKHREELKSRDQKNRKKITRTKYKGLQALANLRAELNQEMQDNWKVFLEEAESGMKTAKLEISSLRKRLSQLTEKGTSVDVDHLKKMLKARKVRETELEDKIISLEATCNCEAKESLRLATELGSLREEVIKLRNCEEEGRIRYRKAEEEVHELRQSRTDLLVALNEKCEHEKMHQLENIKLILRCEFLEAEVAELKSWRSEHKRSRSLEEAQKSKIDDLSKQWREHFTEVKIDKAVNFSDSDNSQPSQKKNKDRKSLRVRSIRKVQKKMKNSRTQAFPRFKQRSRGRQREKTRNDYDNSDSSPILEREGDRSAHESPKANKKQNSQSKCYNPPSTVSKLKLTKSKSENQPRHSYPSSNRVRHFNLSSMSSITEHSEMNSGKQRHLTGKKIKHERSNSDVALSLKSVNKWTLKSAISGLSQTEDEKDESDRGSLNEISLEVI